MQISGTTINSVRIVEDDKDAREGYEFTVEDMGMASVLETSLLQYKDVSEYLAALQASSAEAVLCDYHLQKHNYAGFDGDEIVEKCYQNKIPAVLCTSYGDWETTFIRSRRRFIPALLKVSDLNPDSLKWGWELCIQEFQGKYQPSREAARTLVRVEDADPDAGHFHVVVPGWNPREKVRLLFADLPAEFQKLVTPDKRFHAKANVGCEDGGELFFFDWEAE